jgi:hypothetical protein
LRTVLCEVFILRATLGTKNCHNFFSQCEPENPTPPQDPPVRITAYTF